VTGSFQPAFAADSVTQWSAALTAFHARGEAPFGSTLQFGAALSATHSHFDVSARVGDTRWTGRASVDAQIERPFGDDRLVLGTTAAAVLGAGAPSQSLVFFGGPITGPGYDYHQFSGDAGLSQRVEWRHPAWAVPLPLGRFGSMRMPVTLAPFVQSVWLNSGQRSGAASAGWHESAGLGILTLFDAIRFDVARGLRDGRWGFDVDFTRDFWRIF
jgi:hemolysin activation/secretion protein